MGDPGYILLPADQNPPIRRVRQRVGEEVTQENLIERFIGIIQELKEKDEQITVLKSDLANAKAVVYIVTRRVGLQTVCTIMEEEAEIEGKQK